MDVFGKKRGGKMTCISVLWLLELINIGLQCCQLYFSFVINLMRAVNLRHSLLHASIVFQSLT